MFPILFVSLPLAWWLWRKRGYPWAAAGLALSSLIMVAGTALLALWWIAQAMGELPRPSVRLENKSQETIGLVVESEKSGQAADPEDADPEGTDTELVMIAPGESEYLPIERAEVSDAEACLDSEPGYIVRSVDSEEQIGLPGGECYQGPDAWLDWNGSDLTVRQTSRLGGGMLFLLNVVGISSVVLAGGVAMELVSRSRQ